MTFLSPEWFEALGAALDGAVAYTGPTFVVEVRVVGGEEGAVPYHVVLEAGAPPRYVPGPAPRPPDASYEQPWPDAADQALGRYDPAVGFMQGNLKVKGSSRPLLELFRLWAMPAHRDAQARLAVDAGLGPA
jgi:hypothetical protein